GTTASGGRTAMTASGIRNGPTANPRTGPKAASGIRSAPTANPRAGPKAASGISSAPTVIRRTGPTEASASARFAAAAAVQAVRGGRRAEAPTHAGAQTCARVTSQAKSLYLDHGSRPQSD